MTPKPKKITANDRLELSQQDLKKIQREGMGDDLDLQKLVVHLKSQVLFDSTDRVIDAVLTRSIDSASTIDLTLNDYDRTILRSGALNARLDIQIDGLWFRLVKVQRGSGEDNIQLTFEQREIAILRTYPPNVRPADKSGTAKEQGVKKANRDKTTRAEFILNLIREVTEFDIPVVIPELHKIQPIEQKTDVGFDWGQNPAASQAGIPQDFQDQQIGVESKDHKQTTRRYLTARGARMSKEQIGWANTVIATGLSMHARRKVIICSIMVIIDETGINNIDHGDRDSVGLFQQRDSWGSFQDRMDPATSAKLFFNQAIPEDKKNPDLSYNDLCQAVQRSGTPLAYGQFRWEAQRICNAYGLVGGDDESSAADANLMGDLSFGGDEDYFFYRGKPKANGKVWEREDNWACITRLAEEVGMRAFFIAGVFYYISDDDLFKSQPVATITESTKGIMGIGFDYDIGKKGATVDIPAQVGRWLCPPGAVIVLQDMGPLDGRWLVNQFTRSLFSSNADISLTKPQPQLAEPLDDNIQNTTTWAVPDPGGTNTDPGGTVAMPPFKPGTTPGEIINNIICPIARQHGMTQGIDPAAVKVANDNHGPTVNGTRSDHQGPPDEAWADDMSNGTQPTPEMDALAADLAKRFKMPWSGSGVTSSTIGHYRYQMLYRTLTGGNHYNHVHFGVKKV